MGSRGRIGWALVLLLLLLSTVTYAGTFTDTFDTPYDYLSDGVEGSGWSGIVGGDNAEAIDASTSEDGVLCLESGSTYWLTSDDDYGPFLYYEVAGDFNAIVEVTGYEDVTYNYCGLMARLSPEYADDGEEWVTVEYFDMYSVGNIVHYAEADERQQSEDGWTVNAEAWLQIQRKDNTFTFLTSTDGENWTVYDDEDFCPLEPEAMDGKPVQVGLWQATYSSNTAYVTFDNFSIEADSIGNKPKFPSPGINASDVLRDTELSWTPGPTADVENVYFGTNQADVEAGAANVLVSEEQTDSSYTIEEMLDYGQTYYWCVYDINLTTDEIVQGDVWSFTTEPYAYEVEDVIATASQGDADATIDSNGLSDDLHSAKTDAIWTVWTSDEAWIQYDLNEPLALYEMWVWNGNETYEASLGLGVSEAMVEYSLDGETWDALEETTSFEQAPGSADYECNNKVDMQGITAQYVRITPLSNFGNVAGIHQDAFSLSEVRFYSIPLAAWDPTPSDGYEVAEDEALDVELEWRTGRTAVSHQLYLDTDADAVAEGTAEMVELTSRTYQTEGLLYNETYYWRVDEVAEDAVYEGSVWSWSTPAYLLLDDFESYDEDDNKVFNTWADGYDDNYKYNGATVGYTTGDSIMEETYVISGKQSMPVMYDTDDGDVPCEATITLDGLDWTAGGLNTLVFYVLGERDNTDAELYVEINSSKVSCSANMSAGIWTQINVDLDEFSTNLNNVTSLSIGVEGTGSGTFYIDDVCLYRDIDDAVVAENPGTDDLLASYSFEKDLDDSTGNYDATTEGSDLYEDDDVIDGYALKFNGTDFYVDLPLASKIASMTDSTFAIWVNIEEDSDESWVRAFDFGTETDSYFYVTPRSYTAGAPRAIIMPADSNEVGMYADEALTEGEWHHLAVTFGDGVMTFYVDGFFTYTVETDLTPSDLGTPDHCWLGASPFHDDDNDDSDGYYNGLLDEFKIYERALSAGEIRYLAGDK